jgi:hypothetical protein
MLELTVGAGYLVLSKKEGVTILSVSNLSKVWDSEERWRSADVFSHRKGTVRGNNTQV